MRQTAVEWLIEHFDTFEFMYCNRNRIIDQAKQLEKQQMIEMFDKGFDSVEQLNDDYAIEFAKWIQFHSELWIKYKTSELLEMFKKEKGL